MFRKILVPLDGSPFAEQALPWALSLVHRTEATLDLVRVHVLYAMKDTACAWIPYDLEVEEDSRMQDRIYLNATARYVGALTRTPITSAVVEGFAEEAIAQRAEDIGADLIVMTTHGRRGAPRFFLGSVADELIRLGPAPVLLVRAGETAPGLVPEPAVANVIISLDGSALSEHALEPGLDMARALEAKCTLVRVVKPGAAGTSPAETRAQAATYLQQVAGRFKEPGLTLDARVLVAPQPAEAILDEAGKHADSLIALATHGRGGLRRVVMGSVADQVVRGASMPVMVCLPRRV
jgi:nucleotide-binding universal stress UspA family protein